ncbi:MAG TPA: hypothetical protein VFM42_00160, partial [Sphingomicrobium sp.]|nr:hypothetical protein [Sphingomicrobium sp.]
MRRRWALGVAAAGLMIAPVHAQEADVAPQPVKVPAAAAPAPAPDSSVEPFYAAHPGILVWLRDAGTRAGAAKLAELLKNAAIDGLAEGPALAASVEAALASGTASDDAVISTAWVR